MERDAKIIKSNFFIAKEYTNMTKDDIYTVTEVNIALVTLELEERCIQLLRMDFPWKVKLGDKVYIKDGFIHERFVG